MENQVQVTVPLQVEPKPPNGPKNTSRRRPGRPERDKAGGERVRQDLLEAAKQLFSESGYRGTSSRAIAAKAKVNPAMIHYYFGDKRGLYETMLNETLLPVFAHIKQLSLTEDKEVGIKDFFQKYMTLYGKNAWLPKLFLHDVAAEDGVFRDTFVNGYVAEGVDALPSIVKREIANGVVREDLDPMLAAYSMVGMAIIPFLAISMSYDVVGVTLKDKTLQDLIEHTSRLFMEGARV